ncbi:MAG: S41 family peptidase [Maribacter sp.]
MKKILFILVALNLYCIKTFGQSTVTFKVENVPLTNNQKVGIRGNLPPLSWENSIPLKKQDNSYFVALDFLNTKNDLEFKFVIIPDNNEPKWENIQNRTLVLNENQKSVSNNIWNREQIIDINTLKSIPPELLLEDYELIRKIVLEVHPGTFRYNTAKEIESSLKELKSKFSKPLSYQEAYLAISKVTAQLKCDHTKAGFNNQDKIINSIIHYQADKVPFTFRWIENEMIVTHNASKNELLKRGTKILSINTTPVSEIREQLLQYVGADGDRNNNRIFKTEVNGFDFRYNAFDIFYPLLYPIKKGEIELEIQHHRTNRVDKIHLIPVTREKRFLTLTKRYGDFPKSRDDMWKFEIISDSIAKLTLNSFGLNGWKAMTIDYKLFLANAFDEIDKKEIEHLIIDIRENTGGNDEMSNELFKYLVETNYDFEREGRTRYVKFPESLKPHIKTWRDNPWYYNLNPKDTNSIGGYYIFKDNFTPNKEISNYKVYRGKTYLITSAANTSLAFYTALRFKLQQLGLIIGQETGGNLNDINGGQILFLNLPNSKIEIDFPVMGAFSNTKKPNTGVLPDVEVVYKIDDVLEKRDLELDTILNMIKG